VPWAASWDSEPNGAFRTSPLVRCSRLDNCARVAYSGAYEPGSAALVRHHAGMGVIDSRESRGTPGAGAEEGGLDLVWGLSKESAVGILECASDEG
jgi:hypothetical protein